MLSPMSLTVAGQVQNCAIMSVPWQRLEKTIHLGKESAGYFPPVSLLQGSRHRTCSLCIDPYEVKTLRSVANIAFAFALSFLSIEAAVAQVVGDPFYREWIEYQDGKISIEFDQTPVEVALNIIQVKTGLQIIIPPVKDHKLLNLRLSGLPLEPAVRSLIASIGFRSFALMYDEMGQPKRAVVLEARPEVGSARVADSRVEAQNAEPAVEPLTAEEKAQLQKELEGWSELKKADRSRIEDRLRTLAPSEDREELLKEYGRQLLGIKN
jgi:hypothetical protein